MSKLNVGVGAEFPVDSAEPEPTNEDRDDHCARHGFRGRRGYYRMRAWRRGPFMFAPLLAIVAFIALISAAVSYPGIVLALIAIAILAFALRAHHWHDRYDGPYNGRYERRDRRDEGPQPDAGPDATASGRS